jgi:hypothetical protein
MVFGTWDLNFGAWEIFGYGFQDMVFKTWDLNFGTWISHRGFTVAFGHRHPLVEVKKAESVSDFYDFSLVSCMYFYGACPSILCTHDTPGVTHTLVKFEPKKKIKSFTKV